MPRQHTLTFISQGGLLRSHFNEEEKKKLWDNYGFKKGMNFSWDNEDYRQSAVNPDLNLAIPQEEDFLPYPFRHISATIVGGHTWKATEFPEKVLKKSASMLSFNPAYVNHNLEVGNIVGVVGQTKWTPGFTMSDGTKVPGGIDGPIWVDGKLHTDLCRKLSAFPVPHIQSVSVTVVFEWEPSHVFEDREGNEDLWLFEMRIGQTVDNEMVRRVVTKIVEYHETSFVWLGADPFAKILDEEGKPMNIEKSAIVGMKKFEQDPLMDLYKKSGRYFVEENCINQQNKLDLVKRILQKSNETGKFISDSNKKTNGNFKVQHNKKNMDLVNYLATRLGKQPDEITEDFLKGMAIVENSELTNLKAIESKVGSIEDFDKITGERDKFKSDLEAANSTIEDNKPLVEFANSTLESAKENTLKFYRLQLKGESEDQKTIDLIERASEEKDFDTLESMVKQFGGKAINELEATCKKCGSNEVSFRSTEETDGIEKDEDFGVPNLPGQFRL